MSGSNQVPTKVAEPAATAVAAINERRPSFMGRVWNNQVTLLVIALIVMIVVFTIMNPIFFSLGVAGNILVQWAPIMMIAVGETFVIVAGGIDLSVGSTLTVSSVIAAFAMAGLTGVGWPDWASLLVGTVVAIGVGGLVGTINALLINFAKLVPFVASLATLGAGAGVAVVLTGGGPVAGGPPSAQGLSVPWLGPLSWPAIIVIVIVTIAGLFLHRARFGRYTFAIGGNAFAATASGISVRKHIAKVYILSGCFAGGAGMILYLQLGSGSPSAGVSDELTAIAAVVIGGASLMGGSARIGGSILGALLLSVLTSGLIIINVDANWNQIVVAILIAAAASLQALRGISHRRRA
ncbi:MAG TPA: ABC transporter permease [Galbitalea sp.]|nr:ABC transporter permease [Galbitalea sp.]